MTMNLMQTLNINSNIFQKIEKKLVINLLTIAPKLIQFSQISRFLKEPDLIILGMMRYKRSPQKIIRAVSPFGAPQITIKSHDPDPDVQEDSLIIEPSLSNFQDVESN